LDDLEGHRQRPVWSAILVTPGLFVGSVNKCLNPVLDQTQTNQN